MPSFDQWVLLVEGQEEERGNPFLVVPGSGGRDEMEASTGTSERTHKGPPPSGRRHLMISSDNDDINDEEFFLSCPHVAWAQRTKETLVRCPVSPAWGRHTVSPSKGAPVGPAEKAVPSVPFPRRD